MKRERFDAGVAFLLGILFLGVGVLATCSSGCVVLERENPDFCCVTTWGCREMDSPYPTCCEPAKVCDERGDFGPRFTCVDEADAGAPVDSIVPGEDVCEAAE